MEYIQESDHFFIRLDVEELVIKSLVSLAKKEDLRAARIQGIGALKNTELAFYDLESKKYIQQVFPNDAELLCLLGNLSFLDSEPYFHLHATLSDQQFRCFGGHLVEAQVAVTLELNLQRIPLSLKRKRNEEIGLNLVSFS